MRNVSASIVLIVGWILALAFYYTTAVYARVVNIGILHTNDTMGRIESFYYRSAKPVGGYAKRAILFQDKRRHTKLHWLTLDAGGIFGLAPYSYYLEGRLDAKLMGWLGYDAVGIGASEFVFGQGSLREIISGGNIPFLSANIVETETGRYLAEPFKTLEFDGFRVSLLAVSDPGIANHYSADFLKGLNFKNPHSVIAELVPQLRGISDTIVLISGLPLSENIRIANEHEEISVIVSGGQGAELKVPIKVGGTLIVQAGKWGINVGLLKVTYEGETDTGYKIRYFDGSIIPLDGRWAENTKYLQEITAHRAELEEKWGLVIGKLNNEMGITKVASYETELGDFFTDALKEKARADLAVLNAGAFRAGLNAGPVTRGDIYRAFPGDGFMAVGKISGKNLERMLSQSASLVGTGGFLQVSGVSFGIFGDRAYDITLGGNPLQLEMDYTIAFADTMLGGTDGLTTTLLIEEVRVDYANPVRKVVEDFLSASGEFGNKIEERISYYAEPPSSELAAPPEETEVQEEEVPEEPPAEVETEEIPPDEEEPIEEADVGEAKEGGLAPSEGELGVTVAEEVDTGMAGEAPSPQMEEEATVETETPAEPEAPVIGEVSQVIEEVDYTLRVEQVEIDGAPFFNFHLSVHNASESHKLFTFPTNQLYDFLVYDDEKVVWNFSYNRYFITGDNTITLAPDEEKSFSVYWDGTSNSKTQLERKLYKFVGVLKAVPERSISFTGLFEPPLV